MPKPHAKAPATKPDAKPGKPTKLTAMEILLRREEGATIADLMGATGRQAHSVRGAMSGALKKGGLVITSDKTEAGRVYRATAAAT